MIRTQLVLFFTALQFYTRIPIPKGIPFREENLNPASRFLPLIGWIVGSLAALVWLGALLISDVNVAIVCSMLTSILTTGALHEDGFADACDGFGGGWTKDRILLIMKDSRIGVYGVLGLIGILGLKFSLLSSLALFTDSGIVSLYLISAHALSRLMPVVIIFKHSYARDSDDSKAKPVAQKVSIPTLLIATAFALLPLIVIAMLLETIWIFLALLLLVMVTFLMGRYFERWIGGYTGDCLGAVQQVCEVFFYFFLLVLWKFI